MIYDVRQTTTYAYASPAAYAQHILRLVPIARERQRVTAAALDIDPAPVRRREGRDFFENRTTTIEIDAPHNTLIVKLAARITVEPVAAADFDATPSWESVREMTIASHDLGCISSIRAGSSRSIPKSATMWARAFRPDARSSPAPSR